MAAVTHIDVHLVSAETTVTVDSKEEFFAERWHPVSPVGGHPRRGGEVMNKHLQLVLPSAWIPHNSIIAGHMGVRKTLEKIWHWSYWYEKDSNNSLSSPVRWSRGEVQQNSAGHVEHGYSER